MSKKIFKNKVSSIIILAMVICGPLWSSDKQKMAGNKMDREIILPQPRFDSPTSVEKALLQRRSVRHYKNDALTVAEISQLLWAASGITNPAGFRTAPSAGALYPLELYLAAGKITGLESGIYKYQPEGHKLNKISAGDKRIPLARAAWGQSAVEEAAAVLVFSAVPKLTTDKYGERGFRYVFMEVGHAAQNVALEAVALNLGTVVIGAFNDSELIKIIPLPPSEIPLYLMPVGRP